MKREITYQISKEYENHNIEFFLKNQGFSHGVIVGLKKTDKGILLNDNWSYTRDKLHENDLLKVSIEEFEKPSDIEPVDIPLDIVYEDEDILVVNKAAGMPIHPSMNNHSNTLANAIMHHLGQNFVYRCVNRLDRDTTGLTIIAKNSLSAAILNRAITAREIKRTYLAICEGNTDEAATIDAPIARAENSTIERCVNHQNGERAVTHYRKISYNPKLDLSLIELNLETGRTHQIRVHMKYISHPLIGDFLYNPHFEYIKRQALHSKSLSFVHPISKEKLYFEAKLPLDMKSLL